MIHRPRKFIEDDKFLWKGPRVDGITFSNLCKFLVCRERFRLKMIEGWKEDLGFFPAIEYGTLWHVAEEHFAENKPWEKPLADQFKKALAQHGAHARALTKWYKICKMQFEEYIRYYKANNELMYGSKPLLSESVIDLPYTLPNGSVVRLRGKIDSVFSQKNSIYVKENKTKGQVDLEGLQKSVRQNLQTMFYRICLECIAANKNHDPKQYSTLHTAIKKGMKFCGTLYDVVRRPLADRKHCIVQKKKESETAFIERLRVEHVREDPNYYFMRWKSPVTDANVQQFKQESFDTILMQLDQWYQELRGVPYEFAAAPQHFRMPFGVYNSLGQGFRGDYFEYFYNGSTTGLIKVDNLFPELAPEEK